MKLEQLQTNLSRLVSFLKDIEARRDSFDFEIHSQQSLRLVSRVRECLEAATKATEELSAELDPKKLLAARISDIQQAIADKEKEVSTGLYAQKELKRLCDFLAELKEARSNPDLKPDAGSTTTSHGPGTGEALD